MQQLMEVLAQLALKGCLEQISKPKTEYSQLQEQVMKPMFQEDKREESKVVMLLTKPQAVTHKQILAKEIAMKATIRQLTQLTPSRAFSNQKWEQRGPL